MYTPADIENKRFTTTRLKEGYDQDEVDAFLDGCGEALGDLQRKLADAEQRVKVLQAQNQRLTEAPTSVQAPVSPSAVAEKLIAAAEVAAKQHEDEARAKADGLVRDASAKSARMVEQATDAANKIEETARAEAERIKNDGYAEKYRKFEELEQKTSKQQAALDGLKSKADQVRRSMSEALAAYDRESVN